LKEAWFKFMKRKEQIQQLNDMSVQELNDQADALKESLFRLKFRKTLGVGDTIKDIRRERRTLARVYTLTKDGNQEKDRRNGRDR
jgi:ribosomal protein L29